MFKLITLSLLITLSASVCYAEAFSMEDYLKKTGKNNKDFKSKDVTLDLKPDFKGAVKKKYQVITGLQSNINNKRREIQSLQNKKKKLATSIKKNQYYFDNYKISEDQYYRQNQNNATDYSKSNWKKYNALRKKYEKKINSVKTNMAMIDKKISKINLDIRQAIYKKNIQEQKIVVYENKLKRQSIKEIGEQSAKLTQKKPVMYRNDNHSKSNIKDRLYTLKSLHDDGLIDDNEYANKKKDILESM